MKRPSARAFRALNVFNYRLWAAGALVSNIGTWVQRTAQDWLVFTQLTQHNGSAMGIVMALQFAPQFLLLPWSGLVADRFNQRTLLMATQGIMAVLALALGLFTLLGLVQLWQLYLFAFLFGSAAAIDAPVRQIFVAELVGEGDLPNAVALNSLSFNLGRMIGPAVSGIAIATIGTGWCFVGNGLSFLAVLFSLGRLRKADLFPASRAPRGSGGFVEGLRYVRGRPDLLAILAMLFFIGTFGLNFPLLVSAMGVRIFHTDAAAYGMLSSIMAIGTIGGALLNAGREHIMFRHLSISAAMFGLGCTIAALAPGYWIFAASLIFIGVAALSFTNATNTLMQLSTPAPMRGRVMALRLALAVGTTPIGAPLLGWVADHESPRWAVAVAAASGLVAALIGIYAASSNAEAK